MSQPLLYALVDAHAEHKAGRREGLRAQQRRRGLRSELDGAAIQGDVVHACQSPAPCKAQHKHSHCPRCRAAATMTYASLKDHQTVSRRRQQSQQLRRRPSCRSWSIRKPAAAMAVGCQPLHHCRPPPGSRPWHSHPPPAAHPARTGCTGTCAAPRGRQLSRRPRRQRKVQAPARRRRIRR